MTKPNIHRLALEEEGTNRAKTSTWITRIHVNEGRAREKNPSNEKIKQK